MNNQKNDSKQLPKDWKWAKLGEVADYFNGRGFKKTEWENIGLPIIRIQNLNKENSTYNFTSKLFEDRYKVKNGDLLFAWAASLGTYIWKGKDAWLNQHIFKVEPKNFCDKIFLFYSLEKIVAELYSKTHGSGMVHVTKGKFEATEIPLPPLPTQQAIVSKIEELFSELDKGIEQLKTAQQQLKTYRQAVLKWAFEGKLTNENVKEGELPVGWQECEIRKVCNNIKVGIVVKPTNFYSKDRNGIKAFRSANVREFKINDSDWVYFTEEANEINYRTKLKEGDVLLVRSGYPGTSCVVSKKFDGANAIDILIVTPNKTLISSAYLCAFNNSPLGKGMFRTQSRGVAQKHLNVGEYSKLKINFPSRTEQENIILEIERRLSVADKMEESITQSLQQAEALRQSILKKAFEGRLV